MAVIINATTTTGLTTSADNSGVIQFQSNGANTVGISSTGYITVGGNQQIYGPAFSAENSANQSVSATTYTKLNADTERFDTNSNFASSRFTPTVAGYYQINANAVMNDTITTGLFQIVSYKNGSIYVPGIATPSNATGTAANVGLSTVVYCNGSTDYIEIYAYQTSAAAKNIQLRDFSGCMVRGA